MSGYKFVSVLEAQNDGRPPNDNIEEGDKIVKPGKHNTDSIEYLGESNDIHIIEFEQVAEYSSDEYMTESEAQELAQSEWFGDD